MSDAVITTIISSAVLLLGPIITTIITSISNRKKMGGKIDAIEKKLDAHIKEDEWATAKQCRIRILRFNDDICSGTEYSENHYEEILDDIDFYEKFVDSHPDYHNSKGKIAMKHIKSEYARHKERNDFLGGNEKC